jgi:predicted alpha/beta-fold hydrolase
MTEAFVRRFSPYDSIQDYFNSYAVTPAMLATLQTPVSIITAVDDPVVPVTDFYTFRDLTPYLQLYIQPYGGHVGFIDLFPFRRWVGQAALTILEADHRPKTADRR